MATEVGWKLSTYFSPNDDTTQKFLDYIGGSKESLHVADFAYHIPKATDIFIEKKTSGQNIELILDVTEGHEAYEQKAVAKMRLVTIPVWLTHSTHGKYMHHKFVVRDGTSVLAGSWNFSESASLEDNFFFIIENEQIAQDFMKHWHMIQHVAETQYARFNKWDVSK